MDGKRKLNQDSSTSTTLLIGVRETKRQKQEHDGVTKTPRIEEAATTIGHANPTPSPVQLASLAHILDFSSVDDQNEILERFKSVAKALIHEFVLVVQNHDVKTKFEIIELEFYLQKEGCHEDPFTHGSEEQKFSGKWYFHRTPRRSNDSSRSMTSLTGYRGGSRKGLDLTIGRSAAVSSLYFNSQLLGGEEHPPSSGSTLLRGGILLRSVRRVDQPSKVISGPSLLVDEILRLSSTASIAELVENRWGGNTSALPTSDSDPILRTTSMYLEPASNHIDAKLLPVIYHSPRIGLDLSHPGTTLPSDNSPPHPRLQYLPKPYRFFAHPALLKANGRPQTFLGILLSCIQGRLGKINSNDEKLIQDVVRLMGLKRGSVSKYLVDYVDGIQGRSALASVVGPQGKGAASSPSSYLRMMGALEAVSIRLNLD